MKINSYQNYFLIALLFLISCSSKKENVSGYPIKLQIAPENATDVDFSKYVKIDDLMILEQSTDHPLGEIDKIIMLNDKLLIMDNKQSRALFLYDSVGRFIKKVTTTGNGPGEIGNILDFDINEQNQIIVISKGPSKQTSFTSNGDFISELKLKFRPVHYTSLSGGNDLYEITAIRNNHYFLWGKQGKFLKKEIEISSLDAPRNKAKWNWKGGFRKIGQEIYSKPTLSPVIYQIKGQKVEEKYSLDLGAFTPNYEDYWQETKELAHALNFFQSGEHLIITYYLKGSNGGYSCLLSKKDNTYLVGKTFGEGGQAVLTGKLFYNLVYANETEFISVIPGYNVSTWNKLLDHEEIEWDSLFSDLQAFKDKLREVEVNDNILVRFKIHSTNLND